MWLLLFMMSRVIFPDKINMSSKTISSQNDEAGCNALRV